MQPTYLVPTFIICYPHSCVLLGCVLPTYMLPIYMLPTCFDQTVFRTIGKFVENFDHQVYTFCPCFLLTSYLPRVLPTVNVHYYVTHHVLPT